MMGGKAPRNAVNTPPRAQRYPPVPPRGSGMGTKRACHWCRTMTEGANCHWCGGPQQESERPKVHDSYLEEILKRRYTGPATHLAEGRHPNGGANYMARRITDGRCPLDGCETTLGDHREDFHASCEQGHVFRKEDLFYLRHLEPTGKPLDPNGHLKPSQGWPKPAWARRPLTRSKQTS